MSASALPDDILHAIFRELNGITVTQSRQVCHRWKEAVDSLSDKDWEKICNNELMYQEYVKGRSKYGLSWRDTYKVINSWSLIGSYKMSTQELCDDVGRFKVLPNGIVACLQKNKKNKQHAYCDTIVYYNTETFQQCGWEKFDFLFSPYSFEENEYFKVLVKRDGTICVVVNETKEQFIIGCIDGGHQSVLYGFRDQLTVIEKEIYFKNSEDEIIYVSKFINETGTPTMKTEPLEAFIENHASFEETIIACTIKDGKVSVLCDEGNKANIYVHENADFSWVSQPYYDQSHMFIELQEFGFYWKSPTIYHWLQNSTSLSHRPVFYSHGNVYLTTRSYGKMICIHYCPFYIYGPDHLLHVFKGKPDRIISVKEFFSDEAAFKTVRQLDIIETTTAHKVLALAGEKLFVLEFTPNGEDKKSLTTSQSIKNTGKKSFLKKKGLQAKKNSAASKTITKKLEAVETAKGKKKSVKTARKKTSCVAKKKSVQMKKKTVNSKKPARTLPHKHSYATRSSDK